MAKIELKKYADVKIKNKKRLAMSGGLVAVQLQCVLYVGTLSKLAFHFVFSVVFWLAFNFEISEEQITNIVLASSQHDS